MIRKTWESTKTKTPNPDARKSFDALKAEVHFMLLENTAEEIFRALILASPEATLSAACDMVDHVRFHALDPMREEYGSHGE